ncbi:MAG: fused MFS/spermidine synthase [Pirellulales bacterium]
MTKQLTARLMMANYALATLVSALLLFEVQPIISKFILPWFGGSPAVWTTCMVFFQTLLFAGYAYAHFSVQMLRPRWQAILHVALLAAAVAMLPIAPEASWKLNAASAPTWRILCLLTVSVGLPYFALSATGPLVQAWFSRTFADRSPYRLYALSNVGSLVGLLGYPFYVEPRFALARQTWLWALGFVAFAALCGLAALCAAWARRPATFDSSLANPGLGAPPTRRQRLLWLLLPALASMMLLATTNHVCQDVAVIPFLWVAPLSLYLLSFIICFDHPRWYLRRALAVATLVTLGGIAVMDQLITGGSGVAFSFQQELALHLFGLFCLCMVCHGELVRLRPHPRYLTSFYLMISAGGALGGMFVSLVAPQIFSTFAEWRIGLLVGCLLAAWVVLEGQPQSFFRRRFAVIAPLLLLAFIGLNGAARVRAAARHELFKTARSFYGVISVLERDADDPSRHTFNLYNGRIVHGLQFTDPAKNREPTAYFGRPSGAGQAFAALAGRKDLRVGVVGLGVGTVATYAEPGQSFRFYEINEDVLRFAKKYFTYLDDCRGRYEVVLGDGRLSLEREKPQDFDLLILDVFSGDAVPTHILTKEAFEIYNRHLRPDSVIAVNISNRYLDLSPVIAGLADHFGYRMRQVHSPANPALRQFPADWVLLSPRGPRDVPETKTADVSGASPKRKVLWTDDHSNLFEILK